MTITSKFDGKCKKCGGFIAKGQEIEWSKENGSQHVTCPARQQPGQQTSKSQQPRFHHLEQAYYKAVRAEKKEAAEQARQSDPYWEQLCRQAELECASVKA